MSFPLSMVLRFSTIFSAFFWQWFCCLKWPQRGKSSPKDGDAALVGFLMQEGSDVSYGESTCIRSASFTEASKSAVGYEFDANQPVICMQEGVLKETHTTKLRIKSADEKSHDQRLTGT